MKVLNFDNMRPFKASPLQVINISEINTRARVVQIRVTAGTVWYNVDYWVNGMQANADIHADDFEVVK